MTDIKISALPTIAQGSVGVATDSIPITQGAVTYKVTPTALVFSSINANSTGSGSVVLSTNPVINAPTGIVKADVGLSNVDNTSDATKNAAVATLTNKTLTAPAISAPTGIVKADVGLGNVDNTSDATKDAATATLTNKTLTSPDINGGTVDGAVIGGAVPAAGSFTTLSAAGSATVGNGSGNNAVLVNSTTSGTGGGGAAIVQNGGTSIIAIGNKSALLGGAYNATPMLYGSGATIEVNTGLSVTGRIIAINNNVSSPANIDIVSAAGTTPSPAYQNLNFKGYLGNRSAVIRSFDQSSSVAPGGGLEFLVNPDMGADALTSGMRIDASGNLGLGMSSPQAKLDVVGSIYARSPGLSQLCNISADNDGTSSITAYNGTGAALAFATSNTSGSNTERMRIDASGNLGLGNIPTSSPTFSKFLQVGTSGYAVFGHRTAGTADLYASWNAIVTATGNGGLGYTYRGNDAASSYEQNGSSHRWYTAPSGTAGQPISFTQAMTLDASGNLLVGTTAAIVGGERLAVKSASGGLGIGVQATGSGGVGIAIYGSNASAALTNSMLNFLNSGGTSVGSVVSNGTATTYNTSSDYRLKNIAGPVTDSGAYIDSLKPVQGTWKADGSTFVGLIAHEVQEASRTKVATGTKDGDEMQGMDYSSAEIIANLIAEIQSLRQRVAALEPTPYASFEQFGLPTQG